MIGQGKVWRIGTTLTLAASQPWGAGPLENGRGAPIDAFESSYAEVVCLDESQRPDLAAQLIDLLSRAIDHAVPLHATRSSEQSNKLADAYRRRGDAKQSAPGFGPSEAIADYDRAILLQEALRDTLGEGWPEPWLNDLAGAYTSRGIAKHNAPGFGANEALADHDRAILLREALRDTLGEGWPVPWRNDLATAYMNRGVAKQSAPGFGPSKAIADYDWAILLQEVLRDTLGEGWPVPWRYALAAAYRRRGYAKEDAPGFGPSEAIADYDRAILSQEVLRNTLGKGWPVQWRAELAGAYISRGFAKRSAPGFGPDEAIADYDRAILLLEEMRDTLGEGWQVAWRNELARAYVNRGIAKNDTPSFGPGGAIADYDRAILLLNALRDTLGEDWPVPWCNDLAAAYMGRGLAKLSAPGFGPREAIADYDRAILLQEGVRDTLGKSWPVEMRNGLARTFMNRGIAKQRTPTSTLEDALSDYDSSRAILAVLIVGTSTPFPSAVETKSRLTRATVDVLNRLHRHADAADVADDGLRVARLAEQHGIHWFRNLREQVFVGAMETYRRAKMAAVLPELIFDDLDPAVPGSAADSVVMHRAAVAAVVGALNDLHADQSPRAREATQALIQAQTRLAALHLRQFAGSAALASLHGERERAAGRPDEAERILDRQIAWRPGDPAGYTARADHRCALGRLGADDDRLHAARLTVERMPNPGETGAAAVTALCLPMLASRLDSLAADPALRDPAQTALTRRQFDALHQWLLQTLPNAILPSSARAAWQAPLEQAMAAAWHEAAALRETIVADQERRWAGDLRADIARENAAWQDRAFNAMARVVPMQWVELVRAVMVAAAQAEDSAHDRPKPERDDEILRAVEAALTTETARADDADLTTEAGELAALLGPAWSALTAAEQRFLKVACRCRHDPVVGEYAVLQLSLSVEWMLKHRVLHPVRAALDPDGPLHRREPTGPDTLYAFLVRGHDRLSAGTIVDGFIGATQHLRNQGVGVTASAAIAAWLAGLPNAAALHAISGRTLDRRSKALRDLVEDRNIAAHAKQDVDGAVRATRPAGHHWAAIVGHPDDAFFRYLPALFALPA